MKKSEKKTNFFIFDWRSATLTKATVNKLQKRHNKIGAKSANHTENHKINLDPPPCNIFIRDLYIKFKIYHCAWRH